MHRFKYVIPSIRTSWNEWERPTSVRYRKQSKLTSFYTRINTDAKTIILQVFTSIFTFECIIKLMALSKDFFLCGWNIFDLIIVSASLVDIIFELVDGLSVLRGLRLLRVIKLARSWTTMKVLLKILEQTIGKWIWSHKQRIRPYTEETKATGIVIGQ